MGSRRCSSPVLARKLWLTSVTMLSAKNASRLSAQLQCLQRCSLLSQCSQPTMIATCQHSNNVFEDACSCHNAPRRKQWMPVSTATMSLKMLTSVTILSDRNNRCLSAQQQRLLICSLLSHCSQTEKLNAYQHNCNMFDEMY